jgi:hypothetical protein
MKRKQQVPPNGPPSGAVRVAIRGGAYALVDATDAERVTAFSWSLDSKKRYARRSVRDGKNVRKVYLHHEIMGPGRWDHINGDGLDNRRSNLRPASAKQNAMNRRVQHTSRSGLKGVAHDKRNALRPWRAHILVDGKRLHLGYFDSPEAAARAYDDAAAKAFGDFAWLNFPERQRRHYPSSLQHHPRPDE